MSDGFCYVCKECNKAKVKEWAEKNREHKRNTDRSYYQNNREKYDEKGREWVKRNPDKRKAIARKWAAANKDTHMRWKKKNPDKMKAYKMKYAQKYPGRLADIYRRSSQRRRSQKLGLPDNFTAKHYRRAVEYFGNCCAVCERHLYGLFHTAHADHWVPLSDPACPGTIPTNMVILCSSCNQSKHKKTAAIWLTEKFGPKKAVIILKRISAYFAWVRTQDA